MAQLIDLEDIQEEFGWFDSVYNVENVKKYHTLEEDPPHLRPQEENNSKITDSGHSIPQNLEKHICVPRYKVGGGAWTVIASSGSSYWILPVPQQLNYNSPFNWSTEDLGHGASVVANNVANAINGGSWTKAAGGVIGGGGEAYLPDCFGGKVVVPHIVEVGHRAEACRTVTHPHSCKISIIFLRINRTEHYSKFTAVSAELYFCFSSAAFVDYMLNFTV